MSRQQRIRFFNMLILAFVSFICGQMSSSLLSFGKIYSAKFATKETKEFPTPEKYETINRSVLGNTERETKRDVPLGLEWVRQSCQNPWSFSFNRTSDPEINNTITHLLSRDGKLPRVVVSFTSLPNRFRQNAEECIAVLKNQNYVPDHIYIAIPQSSRRSNESFRVPSWIEKDPLITILRPKEDYGPATKLIPALEIESEMGNTDTRVITMDDDDEGRFGNTKVMDLFAYSLQFNDAAIGLTGWNVTCILKDARCLEKDTGIPDRLKKYNFIKSADDYACHTLFDWKPDFYENCMGAVRKNHIAYADVIEGYRGAVYQPKFFDLEKLKSITDKSKTPDVFFRSDDVWISGWLGMRNVKRVIVNPAFDDTSDVVMTLKKHSETRNLSRFTYEKSEEDLNYEKSSVSVESGLHELEDFNFGNYEAAKWFEEQGGWVKGLWARPTGFKYDSEF